MSFKFIIWTCIVYLALAVLFRLFIAGVSVYEGYTEHGAKEAFIMAILHFFVGIWDLTKFIVSMLILVFIIKWISGLENHN